MVRLAIFRYVSQSKRIEDQFMAAEELPIDEPVFANAVIEKPTEESVLSPNVKNLTLKEIILRRKMNV